MPTGLSTYFIGILLVVISMGLETLIQVGQAIANAFSNINGIGAALVIAGLAILLIIGLSFGIMLLIRVIKQLPNMTVWEFLKVVVVGAIAMIIIGIIIP